MQWRQLRRGTGKTHNWRWSQGRGFRRWLRLSVYMRSWWGWYFPTSHMNSRCTWVNMWERRSVPLCIWYGVGGMMWGRRVGLFMWTGLSFYHTRHSSGLWTPTWQMWPPWVHMCWRCVKRWYVQIMGGTTEAEGCGVWCRGIVLTWSYKIELWQDDHVSGTLYFRVRRGCYDAGDMPYNLDWDQF